MKTTELSRIQWACRRGMLELDCLLETFYLKAYSTLSEEEQQTFIELLGCMDQDLHHWLLGEQEPGHEPFKRLCQKIKNTYFSS